MFVSLWMTRDAITVRASTSISDAALLMTRRRLRHLIVSRETDRGSELHGILSARDLSRAFPPDVNPASAAACDLASSRTVAEIMTEDVLFVAPTLAIEEAACIMRDHKIGALPVLKDSIIVGILTESDVFRAFAELVGVGEAGVRVTFDLSQDEDALNAVLSLATSHRMRLASVLAMKHENRRLGVVRLSGANADPFIDGLWKSGHRVISVERTTGAPGTGSARPRTASAARLENSETP